MRITVSVHPEPLGGYSVSVPELPGCYSEGETLAEALSNIEEAAQLWLEVAVVPQPLQGRWNAIRQS